MSFFVTPPRKELDQPLQKTFVDILYDHVGFLRTHGGKLGDGSMSGKKICVVGAGPAGLLAAYLLTAQGAAVTLLEATDRAGGRVNSKHPVSGDAALFELGAMRVPPSEQLFGYFWREVFKLPSPTAFPDPGEVDTRIVFRNAVYDWRAGESPPSIFDNVNTGWTSFVKSDPVQKLIAYLGEPPAFGHARTLWQSLAYEPGAPLGPEQGYSTISFFQGLVQAFVENATQYGCRPWTADDFALFGALGLGSGGFGPLYQVNFAEIVRLIVNGLETNQQFYSVGLESLTDSFTRALPADSIQFNRRVKAVFGQRNGASIKSVDAGGATHVECFDAVIIATTTRSMQVDMELTEPNKPAPPMPMSECMVITNPEATAVQELHLMNSSKLFVLTSTKFWNNTSPTMPQNIQTDGLVRGLYCLDYPNSNFGVVLVSYTWGDDSTKYIAIKEPNERLDVLLRSLSPYSDLAPFVSALSSGIMRDYTTLIDWQDQRHYYGAFKLNYPGQDPLNQRLYYQFLNTDNPVYLAGDSVGWCAGWIESALQTGVNAAAAAINRLCGPAGLYPDSPMTQTPSQYLYGP